MEANSADYGEKSDAEFATAVQLALLFDSTATWVGDNTPLYIGLNDLVNGEVQYYNDLPFTKDGIPSHIIEVPGELVAELEPDAAQEIDITEGDLLRVIFSPAHYQEPIEPGTRASFCGPGCSYEILTTRLNRGEMSCYTSNNAYVDWTGDRVAARHKEISSESMLAVECRSLTAISNRFQDFYNELVARDLYPKNVLEERRNYDMGHIAQNGFDDLETLVRQAAEDRLNSVKTCGKIGNITVRQFMFSSDEQGRAYTHVSEQEVNELRVAIADRLLITSKSFHIFEDRLAQEITPAFHNSNTAIHTKIMSISLKAESSKQGAVFTFTLAKNVLRKDGTVREEIESYSFNKDRYLRLITVQEVILGPPTTIAVQGKAPLKPVQVDVFRKLLPWIDAAETQ